MDKNPAVERGDGNCRQKRDETTLMRQTKNENQQTTILQIDIFITVL
jgi:hypothetical protein